MGLRGSHTHHSCLLGGKPRGQKGRGGSWELGGQSPTSPKPTEPQLAGLPPASPFFLPSSALQGLFQQGEERTAGPMACSLLPQGLALWGVLQAGSLHLHLPHPQVNPEFSLMHQPLEQSQLEADGETGQDAVGRSQAPIPDLNPNSAVWLWFVPDSAHSWLFLCQLLETLPCRQWLALPLWVPVYSVAYGGTAQG